MVYIFNFYQNMKKEFISGFKGSAFDGKKFYEFKPSRVLVLSAGEDPRCWIKTKRKPYWHSSRKAMNGIMNRLPIQRTSPTDLVAKSNGRYMQLNGQLVEQFAISYHERYEYELYRYQQLVPPEVLQRICQFSDRRWQIYNLLVRVPNAIELCDSNPSLVYMLANNWVFHAPAPKNHFRSARSLVLKKQTDTLKWLGFDGIKSTRKILQKILPPSIKIQSLLYLRNGLNYPETRKLLSHVSAINCGVLRLATDPLLVPHLTPRLLEEISTHQDSVGHLGSYDCSKKFKNFVYKANQVEWEKIPAKIKSLKQLDQLNAQLSETLERNMNNQFLPPPFPGTDTIFPIQTLDALKKEAIEQENCVLSYAPMIHSGHIYIYRVLSPIRATLGIQKRRNDRKWRVFEITGFKNTLISKDIKSVIINALLKEESA